MKKTKISIAVLAGLMLTASSCKKWLDINTDPDTPQNPGAHSVFPTQLAAISRGIQWDGRFIGKYIQNWQTNTGRGATEFAWDKHGYVANTDNGGDIFRMTYFGMGQNLNYIIDVARAKGQWDYIGAAYALKAWSFQVLTDIQGETIYSEAFKTSGTSFNYDSQEEIYTGIRKLCDSALLYLNRTDLDPANIPLKSADYVYDGDVSKWKKFVYGLLARNYNNLSNKADFDPAKVVAYVDQAMASGNDDFLLPFDGTKQDDANFFGPSRDNLTHFRQSAFVVGLMDGTILAGNKDPKNRDPRISHMLVASKDTSGTGNGGYRGCLPGEGDPNSAGNKGIPAPWQDSLKGNPRTAGVFIPDLGKYLFKDKTIEPVMTYAEMQFIKAEALYRKGTNIAGAHEAYKNGIRAHMAFINKGSFARANVRVYNGVPIPQSQIDAYMISSAVKQTPNDLRLSDIMLQKYIALFGWGFVETWTDLRKYHYVTDQDPVYGDGAVYKGFALPATMESSNQGKPVYRLRPRYNSEYIWNRPTIERLGGMNPDYHTYELWYSKP